MLVLVVIEEETSEVFEAWCSPSNGGETRTRSKDGLLLASTATHRPDLFYVGGERGGRKLKELTIDRMYSRSFWRKATESVPGTTLTTDKRRTPISTHLHR